MPARAEPPTARRLNGGASVLWGFWAGEDTGGINPYGLGLGLNAGYTFARGLHLGAGFQYFFGGSEPRPGGNELSLDLRQALAIGAWDFGLAGGLVLRPELGVGVIWTSSENCGPTGCQSDSGEHLVLRPGARLLYVHGPLYGTAEAAYNLVVTEVGDADGVLVGLGVGAAW